MPREYIRSSDWEPDIDELDDRVETMVDLSWSREAEYVQVGTVGRDRVTHETVHPPTEGGDGWYVQLDRRGCNDLIRKVRRARDQAFGRDE